MYVWILLLSVCGFPTLVKTEICRFGDVNAGCALPCNCINSGCDKTTGTCTPGGTCPEGRPFGFPWHGPGCRIGNLAYKKDATQLGQEWVLVAGLAVDGTRGTNTADCAHPQGPEDAPPAWWYVDLGDVFRVNHVTLYNRRYPHPAQNLADRMGNFRIGMANDTSFTNGSGVICLNYPENVPNGDSITLNCSVNNVGRYFFLHKNPHSVDPPLISICEVVLDGYRAIDCSQCLSACNDLTGCDRCPPGYRYPDCKQECNRGKWGDNCESDCSAQCKDFAHFCNIHDGACSGGCKDGQVNEVWYYGPHCNRSSDPNGVRINMNASDVSQNTKKLIWSSNIPPDSTMYFMYQSWYEARDNIILNQRENHSIEAGPGLHQARTFSDLTPATNYTFYVRILRVSSNGSVYALESSTASLKVTTAKVEPTDAPESSPDGESSSQISLIAGVAAGSVLSLVLAVSLVVLLLKKDQTICPP